MKKKGIEKKDPDFFFICKKYFYKGFQKKLLREAEKIYRKNITNEGHVKSDDISFIRRDHRSKVIFTIDGSDAQDLDDAVSILKTESGYVLFVYIADVSYYVYENSILDLEARNRGNSVYLINNVIPMFPKIISNNLCSLNQGFDRFAICVEMEISFSGKLISYDIYHALITINKQLTYEKVQNILDQKDDQYLVKNSEVESLFYMKDLAEELYKRRIQKGSIDFNLFEIGFELNDKFNPLKVFKKRRYFSNRIIEEFMLLTNCVVAKYLNKKNSNLMVYRVHEPPSQDDLISLRNYLKKYGYKNQCTTSKDFQRILNTFRGDIKEEFFSKFLLRLMKKARYDINNIGHFGLSFKNYIHFTSPIRRYSDLIIHYLVKKILQKQRSFKKFFKNKKVAIHISYKERQAIEAEREIIKRKSIRYMYNKVGKIFFGSITGFSEYGIYVQLKNGIEGLIPRETLDVCFKYDKKNYCYSSKKTIYDIGQNIKIKVNKVDCHKFFINFSIC